MNFNIENLMNSVCIYYFPQTQHITTNIWSKYSEIENVMQRKNYFRNDQDVNTILDGKIWYVIYVTQNFMKRPSIIEELKSLVKNYENNSSELQNNDCIMIVKYNEHKVVVHPSLNDDILNKLIWDEFNLTEILKTACL